MPPVFQINLKFVETPEEVLPSKELASLLLSNRGLTDLKSNKNSREDESEKFFSKSNEEEEEERKLIQNFMCTCDAEYCILVK